MEVYTAVYRKLYKLNPFRPNRMELITALIEAESPALASHAAHNIAPNGRWIIDIEPGDTRYKHPGAQDLVVLPAQIDISEVVT